MKYLSLLLSLLVTSCMTTNTSTGGSSSMEATTKQKTSQKTDIEETRDMEIMSTIEIPIKHLLKNPDMPDDEVNKIIENSKLKNATYKDGMLTITNSVSSKSGSSTKSNTDALNDTMIKMQQQMQAQASASFSMQLITIGIIGLIIIVAIFIFGWKKIKQVKGVTGG